MKVHPCDYHTRMIETAFNSFTRFDIDVNGVRIHGVRSAATPESRARPPLLLLHGYPQSHLIWHKVAGTLAERYAVIATDLRGYGESSKPARLPDHANYSKREMARDQVELMRALGFDAFFVCGHDRGGRVAHRMALDYPEVVKKLVVLDISPTLTMYEETSMDFALGYWWWFFLVQPAPFPETLISASPEAYLASKLTSGLAGRTPFTDETYAAYLGYMRDLGTVHSMCEDYRAAASIDLVHDRADREAGKKIVCPLYVLWGEYAIVHRCFAPLQDWRKFATTVSGQSVASGHYIPEEIPNVLISELITFLG